MHASQSFFGDIAVALLCLIIGPTLAEAQIVEDFNPGANELIWATACQPDGKIWVGGAFTSLGASPRLCLGRLLPDGTLDPTPDIPFAGQRWVTCLALQPDGKILVSGWFFIPNRATNICRLNADGSLDSSFVGRSDRPINSLLLQRDGKIVVGGCFTNLAGQSRQSIGRLRPDGSLDASFLSDAPGTVNTLALQLDGKILVGGSFTNLGGVPRNNLGRLNADGSVDLNFDPAPNLPVTAIQLQPNGQIVVTGDFYLISGQSRSRLARINNDGTLDSTFSPQPHGQIFSLALQADGKILAGGFFTTFGDQATTNLARLNSDGSVDASFSLSTDYYLQSLALQADGKLIAAGYFSEVNGLGRSCIARLDIGTASETLSSDGFTINWMRLGSVPELQGCTFAYSTNGTDWVDLGPGSVAPGSWQLTGIAIPASSSIWALGSVSGGYYNGSSWLVSSFYGPPAIISQPLSRTNSAGSIAPFSVVAGGSSPVKYCWLKNGNALAGGANITGVTTPLLVLSNVLGADAGSYSVIISNSLGSLTSSVATLTVTDPFISRHPISTSVAPGQSNFFDIIVQGTSPVSYMWRKQGLPIPGATLSMLPFSNAQPTDAGLYDAVVSNVFGVATSAVCSLTVNQATLDSFNPGADIWVSSIALQRDGSILVGGPFSTIQGYPRPTLARLNNDGSLDYSFNPPFGSAYSFSSVTAFAIQPDGKIIIGGVFYGQGRTNIARINLDGTLDPGFTPIANSNVLCLALQPDGKILVGGQFTRLGAQVHDRLARLNADGTIDGAFNPSFSADPALGIPVIQAIAILSDGHIVACGWFTEVNGEPRKCIARLNNDGSLDGTFDAGDCGPMYCLAVQANDQIVVGGQFTTLGGEAHESIGRLNSNGTVDSTFQPIANNFGVQTCLIQADGRILLGGGFTNAPGQCRDHIERLNADGSLDTSFDPGANEFVYALAVQTDGKILVGGFFTSLGGAARSKLGRLNNSGLATQSINSSNGNITWLRGGVAAEASRTTFDISTNGTELIDLGAGTRTVGGWQLTGMNIPPNAAIRARAYFQTSSTWFEEQIVGAPLFVLSPNSRTNSAFSVATFSAEVSGTPPFSYRWMKDGSPLQNGGKISGATTPTLSLANVLGPEAGDYSLCASNDFGAVTSHIAHLTVLDPVITLNPVSRIGSIGETVTFTTAAVGSTPLSYQWRKNSAAVPGAAGTALTLNNLVVQDEGIYDVQVSNSFGSVSSSPATLRINQAIADTLSPTINNEIFALAVQPDKKILVGGVFTFPRGRLARLNWDGSLDTNFNANAGGPATLNATYVSALALQEDGKIIVGGSFTNLAGQACTNLGRLNLDSSLDTGFRAFADSSVNCLAVQADGKILVGGNFITVSNQARRFLARINTDGSVDLGFNPNPSAAVNTLALQNEGKIVVGGNFTTVSSIVRSNIARLNPTGTLDFLFNPGARGSVLCFAIQADGKILVGGGFTNIAGQNKSYLARLNANGTLDSAFNPAINGTVVSLSLQADGKILAAGSFTNIDSTGIGRITRLFPDGTLDVSFAPQPSSSSSVSIQALAVQPDGKVLVAGSFDSLAGEHRVNIGRVVNPETAVENLQLNGSGLTWLRSASSPELGEVKFEFSTNGTTWTSLGAGARVAGGWQLTTNSAPQAAAIRARGYAAGGRFNGSSWIVESTRPALSEVQLTASGLMFRVVGSLGQSLVLEVSTDLKIWSAIATNTITVDTFYFTDTDPSTFPARFYRARTQ